MLMWFRHAKKLTSELLQCFCSPPSYLALLAVFGHVIDGLDTLDRMEKIPSDAKDRPKQEIKIERVTIHANPLAT